MKDKMGTYHSSINCERLSTSLHDCFGFGSSTHQYETETSKKSPQPSSILNNDDLEDVATLQPKKKFSSKRRTSGDVCCCRGAEPDEFPYNVCNPSPDSQPDAQVPSSYSSSVTQSRSNSRDRKSSDDASSSYNTPDNAILQAHSPLLLLNGDSHGKRTSSEARNKLSSSTSIKSGAEETSNISDSRERLVSVGSASNSQSKAKRVVVEDCLTMNDAVRPVALKPPSSHSKEVSESISTPEKQPNDVCHFRDLITSETSRLNESISKWNKVLRGGNSRCPADVCDEIRTVIGQTNLVISERFVQFSKLIDRADGSGDLPSDELPVLLSDLQGFWDMIYFQVEDVDAKFSSLEKLQANQWKSSSTTVKKKADARATSKPKAAAKKTPAKKKIPASNEDKKRREAARKRISEARKALANRNQVEQSANLSESSSNPRRSAFTKDVSQTASTDEVVVATDGVQSTRRRPESIVDAVTCAVAVTHANNDSTSLSSVSSTGLVHG